MDTLEFNVDEKLRPSVERELTGSTALDTKIASIHLSNENILQRLSIILLRTYREIAPKSLRNRCVFEPSCSHYSEAAIRQHGVLLGLFFTLKRLNRCKSKNGGIDLIDLNKEKI